MVRWYVTKNSCYVGTLVCYEKHNIPMCQPTIYKHFHIIAGVSNGELDPLIFISMMVCWYVRMGRRNSSTNVPTEFTCISIQMVRWYVTKNAPLV